MIPFAQLDKELSIYNSPDACLAIPGSFKHLQKLRKLIINIEADSENESEGLPLFLLFLPALQELEIAHAIDEYESYLIPQLHARL